MTAKLKDIFFFLASPIWLYFKYLNLATVLSVKKINKKGVFLYERPDRQDRLFVIKLTSDYDLFRSLDISSLKKTLRYYDDSQFNYFFIKQEIYEMGYIATFSEKMAYEIRDKLGYKICNTTETIKFLLDLYSINRFQANKKDFTINPSLNIGNLDKESFFDSFFYNFNRILSDGAYIQNEEYDLFQVVKFNNKSEIPYKEVFDKNFNGVLSFYVDLSNKGLTFKVDDFYAYTKRADRKLAPEASKLFESNKTSSLNQCTVNGIILSSKEAEARKTASRLGLEIIKKDGFDKLYMQKKTFLMTRELDYDQPVPSATLSKMIGVRTKKLLSQAQVKQAEVQKPWIDMAIDFYGYNMYGSFVNFCFRADKNPHATIIADSGSGKSVNIQKILSSIYRVDYEKDIVDRWDKVKTRYFEVGNSSEQLQKFFKRIYGEKVGLIEGSLEQMKFSVCDIKTRKIKDNIIVDKESLSISIKLLNVILHENRENPFTGSEQTFYEKAIKQVYIEDKFKGITIAELKEISYLAYKDKIDEFYSKGHTDITFLKEIDDCGDISYLKKPMVKDIINKLSKDAESTYVNQQEKAIYESLIIKLNAIAKIESSLFGSLNSMVLDNKPFYAIEFSKIKKNQSLLKSIFCFLFVSIYEADVEDAIRRKRLGKKMLQTVYIFEELRNFVEDNPEIVKLLKVLIFEGRKYQLQGIFIAQKMVHVPNEILTGCSTFMFLLPTKEEEKIDLTKKILEQYDTPAVRFLLNNIEKHTLGIISGQGTFSCKLDVTPKELKLFSV